MKYRFSILVLVVSLVLVAPASGAMIKGGEVISVPEIVQDDLYIAGGQVDVAKQVNGDLIAAGGEVTVSGDIDEDVIIAGGRITLTGEVGDDVRMAGGELRISSVIHDDLFVAGGRVELSEDASIDGDVRIAGGELFIDGTITGNVHLRGGRIVLRGLVEGNVDVEADDITIFSEVEGQSRIVANQLTLGDSASFSGDVEYWTQSEDIDFTPYLNGAGASFNANYAPKEWNAKKIAPSVIAAGIIINIVSSVLFAAFFILLASFVIKGAFIDSAKILKKSPGASTLTGFLYFVVVPILILLLMISIIGIPVSLLSGFFYGFSVYFAKPIASMIFARSLEARTKKKWKPWKYILVSIGIYSLLKIVSLIPVLGWAVIFILVCSAYGSLILTKWHALHNES